MIVISLPPAAKLSCGVMFFRFSAAIGLMTAISLAAVAIEKQNLSLRRAISLQHYQLEVLQEQKCRQVLETQRLSSPVRLLDQVQKETTVDVPSRSTQSR